MSFPWESGISNTHPFCCPERCRVVTPRLRLCLSLGQLQELLLKGLSQQRQGKRLLNPHPVLNLLS